MYQGYFFRGATNYSTEPTITPTCGVNYPITVRLRQDINSDQSRLIMIFFSYKLLDKQDILKHHFKKKGKLAFYGITINSRVW